MMFENTNRYFAYGSNLKKSQMEERCPNSKPCRPAQVEGWKLTFRCRDGEKAVANIEPAEGEQVYGAIYELTQADWEELDRYEGVPKKRYYRETLPTRNGEQVVVYIMTEGDRPLFGRPSTEYEEKVRTGFRDWNLPEEALDKALEESARMANHADSSLE